MKKLLVLIAFVILASPVYATPPPAVDGTHYSGRVYTQVPDTEQDYVLSRNVKKAIDTATRKLDTCNSVPSLHSRAGYLYNYVWDANMIIGDVVNDIDQRLKGTIFTKKKMTALKSKFTTQELEDFKYEMDTLRTKAISLLLSEDIAKEREEIGYGYEFLAKTILNAPDETESTENFTQATYHKTVFKASEKRGIVDTFGFEVFDHFTGKIETYWAQPFSDKAMSSGKAIPEWEQGIFIRSDARTYLGTVLRIDFNTDGTMKQYEVIERFKDFSGE